MPTGMAEPPQLTKSELKKLRDTLGKQGMTVEQHIAAQYSPDWPCKVLEVDCFSFDNGGGEGGMETDGWVIGYPVQYNGIGLVGGEEAQDHPSSTSSDSSIPAPGENREDVEDESSGFESDTTTDDDEDVIPEDVALQIRRESADSSEKGQLLHGIDDQFYVDIRCRPIDVTVHDAIWTKLYQTSPLVTTNRFEVAKSTSETAETDDEIPQGYQMIGDGTLPSVTSHSEDSEDEDDDDVTHSEDVTTSSSGLWCNFIIAPKDLISVKKTEIPEEKLKTIPLDKEKLAQISAAMANFKLPTPPGWEGVSDSKLLEFIKQRI